MKATRQESEDQGEVVVQKIPLDLLVPSPYNSRRCRTEERIREIAQSLSIHGQQEPLRVYPGIEEGQGKFLILSGVTRFMSAKALGWQQLDAWVDLSLNPNDPLSLLTISRLHNETSEETDIDYVEVVNNLQAKGFDYNAIAAALGYNTFRKVYKLKAFNDLPEEIYKLALENPAKITAEFAVALKHAVAELGRDEAILLAEETVTQNLSLKKLLRRIQARARKMKHGQKRTQRQTISIHYGREKVGNFIVTYVPDLGKMKVSLQAHLPEGGTENFAVNLANAIRILQEESADYLEEQQQ